MSLLQLKKHFCYLCFIICLLKANGTYSQDDVTAPPNLVITGAVKKSGKRLDNATVTIYKNSRQTDQLITSKDGIFELKLDYNSTYIIEFSKAGFVSKKIEFGTTTPSEKIAEGFNPFEFEISLFESNPKINTDILKQPVAKVSYNPKIDDFDYDPIYSKQIQDKLAGLEEELMTLLEEEEMAKEKAAKEVLAKQKAEETAKKTAEEEARKKAEADAIAKKKAEEEAAKKAADEAAKKAAEEEVRKKAEADAIAKKKAEEEAAKKAAEEAAKKAADEEARKKAEADAIAKKKAEDEAAKKAAEEAAKKAADEEARKKAEAKALFEQQQANKQANTALETANNSNQVEIDKAVKLSDEVRSKDFLSELAQKYPEGITVENFQEANRTITRVIVNRSSIANEYKKVKYNWGGLYFFKNNMSISQNLFELETKQ
jgi:hypothetical protein